MEDYCRSCPEWQLSASEAHFKNHLIPLPIIDVPFERIAMDLVGPWELQWTWWDLVKSTKGHQYILVILDYATR